MMELLGIIGGQVLRVVVGTLLPHIPDIPSNVLGIHLFPILSLICLQHYLLRRYILLVLLTAKVSDFHTLDSRHLIFSY